MPTTYSNKNVILLMFYGVYFHIEESGENSGEMVASLLKKPKRRLCCNITHNLVDLCCYLKLLSVVKHANDDMTSNSINGSGVISALFSTNNDVKIIRAISSSKDSTYVPPTMPSSSS